jgi:oxalate decarboxylase/phosphoglucose isomerase-like protein (cupin superfamily)
VEHVPRPVGRAQAAERGDRREPDGVRGDRAAGADTTFHLHYDSDELVYVLSGEFTFKIDDQVTSGGPGTCAFIPRGVAHAWKNAGAEPGRALFLYTPGGAGRMFEEARRLQRPLSSMADREVAEFFKRFGWETLGPPPF